MKILVIDIGGTHVKILASGQGQMRRFDPSPSLTPSKTVSAVLELAEGWQFAVSKPVSSKPVSGKPVSKKLDPSKLDPSKSKVQLTASQKPTKASPKKFSST